MQASVSPKLLLVGIICAVLVMKGKVKLAMTLGLGYFACVQVFQMMFPDDDVGDDHGDHVSIDAIRRVQAILPNVPENDVREQLRQTGSVEAAIQALSTQGRGNNNAVVRGAPKGRNRTVSFQSKKDSIFDKYRDRYLEMYPEKVKRNLDHKAAGHELELDQAMRECRQATR
eukprot:m.186370 g.186370  ORF g.186370 m.186370 type:complete len:172 (+) comp16750_c0_seq1:134-649(+)